MDGERIFLVILMTLIDLLCAGIFFGIGMWAKSRKDPMHFYSGTTVDPRTISDIPAYNRENEKLWKTYAAPYFLCAACAFGSIWAKVLMTVSIVVLVLACTVGGVWLVLKYNKILSTYKIR